MDSLQVLCRSVNLRQMQRLLGQLVEQSVTLFLRIAHGLFAVLFHQSAGLPWIGK